VEPGHHALQLDVDPPGAFQPQLEPANVVAQAQLQAQLHPGDPPDGLEGEGTGDEDDGPRIVAEVELMAEVEEADERLHGLLTDEHLMQAAGLLTPEYIEALGMEAIGVHEDQVVEPAATNIVNHLYHQVAWYAARLDHALHAGTSLTLRNFLHTQVWIHKVNGNSTDGLLHDQFRVIRAYFPDSLCPPSWHIVKQLLRIKALQECEWHIWGECYQWAWKPEPDRSKWHVAARVKPGQVNDLTCFMCGAPRFIKVQRPGERAAETRPTMVSVLYVLPRLFSSVMIHNRSLMLVLTSVSLAAARVLH
jgi:hypothetical protein